MGGASASWIRAARTPALAFINVTHSMTEAPAFLHSHLLVLLIYSNVMVLFKASAAAVIWGPLFPNPALAAEEKQQSPSKRRRWLSFFRAYSPPPPHTAPSTAANSLNHPAGSGPRHLLQPKRERNTLNWHSRARHFSAFLA